MAIWPLPSSSTVFSHFHSSFFISLPLLVWQAHHFQQPGLPRQQNSLFHHMTNSWEILLFLYLFPLSKTEACFIFPTLTLTILVLLLCVTLQHNPHPPHSFPCFPLAGNVGVFLLFLFYLSYTHSVTPAPLFLAVWPRVSQPPPFSFCHNPAHLCTSSPKHFLLFWLPVSKTKRLRPPYRLVIYISWLLIFLRAACMAPE